MSLINNPQTRAAHQSKPSSTTNWDETFRRIMALTAANPSKFASQPRSNRFDQILEAAVPSRVDPTHEKVLSIVNALVETGAVRPDEGGQIFDALLERVSRYNSVNVQTNLDRLVTDVREAVARKERTQTEPSLASLVALNAFLNTIPAVVNKGQDDYLAFISALRLLVTEVPQTDVYRSGPHFFFSSNKSGSQTVNLTNAFKNLSSLWGVKSIGTNRTSISSILTPNTRLLLLMVAPFTDSATMSKDSYIGHILTLYRETIGQTSLDESTYNEITSVSKALGDQSVENLQSTLNFLLTNKTQRVPRQYRLSKEEERILRFVQQSVSLYLLQDGATPSTALDLAAANFEPSFYAANRNFINRLMDYFHRAAAMSTNYFTNAVLNANWLPPEGFFTGDFDFPDLDDLLWDDSDSTLYPQNPISNDSVLEQEQDDLSHLGAAAPPNYKAPILPSKDTYFTKSTEDYLNESQRDFMDTPPKNSDFAMENLVDELSRWKTHAQTQKEERERWGVSGSGVLNPFGHLRPKGRF